MSNQMQCQTECEAYGGCIGISYQQKYANRKIQHCKMCMNDDLTAHSDGYGFYRKPG